MLHAGVAVCIHTLVKGLVQPLIRKIALDDVDLLDVGVHHGTRRWIGCSRLPSLQYRLAAAQRVFVECHFLDAGRAESPVGACGWIVEFELLHLGGCSCRHFREVEW